jgi:hypothetical protein
MIADELVGIVCPVLKKNLEFRLRYLSGHLGNPGLSGMVETAVYRVSNHQNPGTRRRVGRGCDQDEEAERYREKYCERTCNRVFC